MLPFDGEPSYCQLMSIFVVVNPQAGSSRTGRRWPDIAKRIAGQIGSFDHALTTGSGEASHLARHAIAGGATLVIAVGGDGTISETVNGFTDAMGTVNATCAFAAISEGTGADFARNPVPEGYSNDPIAAIASAKRRHIDLGRVTYTDDAGQRASRLFVNIASMGLSGAVDRQVNADRMTGFLPGKFVFYLATLRALMRHENQTVRLTIDDTQPFMVDLTMAAIANGQYFGGGMRIAPQARLDSGLFEIIVLSCSSRLSLIKDLSLVYRGAHMNHPMIMARKGRRIVAEVTGPGNGKVPLDIDGESPGYLKAEFEILPGALLLQQ
tara:strand:- start:57025 stop:57999 length:975 start_codon:yes stop_codon:yes gene_type:complete